MSLVAVLGAAVVSVVVGVLVLVRGHQRAIGSLLVVHGLSFALILGLPGEATSHTGLVVEQLAQGSWVFLFLWLVLIAYLLPDGRFASTRWRAWVSLGLVGVVCFLLGAADDASGFREAHPGVDPPLAGFANPGVDVLGLVGLLATVLLLLGSALAVRARLRGATGSERVQLLWLVWGATSLPAALLLGWVNHFVLDDGPFLSGFALTLAGAALPVTIGIAILRHRLFDIQVVLSRTLTYGALLLGALGVYAALLLVADHLVQDSTVGGLVAVGVAAVAVHPAYAWLRTRIERWVYGYRSDPAVALRRLGATVEAADPLRLGESIARSVAEALKVDVVRIEKADREVPSEENVLRVPLVHRGESIGVLAIETPADRTLSVRDVALARDLARHAAVTVRAGQLAGELQAARLRLVTATEEERKRLRRDLHDGLGPSLAAVVLKLDAARREPSDAERDALLREVRAETRAAIAEVRRIVDDLRPPAIDEVGLTDALRQRAASLSSPTLSYEVAAPEHLPALPAAVEVAAYRIASEAMSNVARHSGASRCVVELTLAENLVLSVADNGNGAFRAGGDGIGHTSMTERAEELGGSCTAAPRPDGGLVVSAVLPLLDVRPREVVS